MNCAGIREFRHEYLKGWCPPDQAASIEGHLASCAVCAADLRETQSALSLLGALPEVEASPETWKQIESKLPSFARPVAVGAGASEGKPRKPAVFRFWLRTAAAASVLVAVVSFSVLFMPRSRALPVVAETNKALAWNEPFTAPAYRTIEVPDVGTLKVNRNATLRFLDPRTCLLESGELFAEIDPSGKGFEIRTAQTSARVRGTRFGVTAPATIYVVEGRVEVTPSQGGTLTLGPRQAAVGPRLAEISAEDHLRWLAQHERPTVRLTLDPLDRTTITPGAPLKWNLILETDALAPLYLGDPRDISQFLTLAIDGAVVPLDASSVSVGKGTSVPNGLLRLDVSHPCVIECAVDPALFRQKGRAAVRAFFTSGANAPEGAWWGAAKSNAITVEVR